jgi:ATP adenylyltransferase
MSYLEDSRPSVGCFLCDLGAEEPVRRVGVATDADGELALWLGREVYALLNAYPYANGHVMVAPYAHVADLDELPAATAAEMMSTVRLMIRALRRTYHPQGFNVGANLGSAAGAGFADHLHFHVVPRWSGDTNFMTATGDTRVLPEALDETARRVRAAITAIGGESD